ncbi:hypothetical protein [Sulfuricystis multivorans]|uniref:hypothetical protein n=1 Tax=Sulfuricystis multivorans TaxID=2211108 RepID=UPI000F8188B1|nr:hypothetical protein [Sulfuricystis multivorans]
MNLLFHVTTAQSGALLVPLVLAARRANASFAAFFTHEGVKTLQNANLVAALAGSRAVVCEESWHRFCPGLACPVENGSQTINSALMAEAERVVSL